MTPYNLRPRNPHGFVSPNQNYTTIHLRLLPPELRDMIFRLSFLRTDGKTPPLLIALRADTEIYCQAVRVYYAVNEFEVYWGRGLEWLGGMKKNVLGLVRRVVVVVPKNQALIPQLHDALALLPALKSLKIRATNTTALRKFNLSSLLHPSLSPSTSTSNTKLKFQFLTELKIQAKLKTDRYPGDGPGTSLLIRRLSDEWDAEADLKKIKGSLVGTLSFEPREEVVYGGMGARRVGRVVLSWEAGKGKTLMD